MDIISNTAPLSALLGITSDAGSMTAGLAPSIIIKADVIGQMNKFNYKHNTDYGKE